MSEILLVRHGNTTYDNKVDAFLNPPLDEDGLERIKRTVGFLDSKKLIPSRIVSSPLQRSFKVAELISRGNVRVTFNNACLPWNLGDLMGKTNAMVDPAIKHLENYPDLKAPHGESYRNFISRWGNFLYTLMQYAEVKSSELLMVTTHSRNINSLPEVLGERPIGFVAELAPEGSVTRLYQDGDNWKHEMIWAGK